MNFSPWEEIRKKLHKVKKTIWQILYGMTAYEWIREIEKSRGELERIFILVVFGDFLGIPLLPPYYTLRLLPYIIPNLEEWRRSILRERDLTDLFDQDIG